MFTSTVSVGVLMLFRNVFFSDFRCVFGTAPNVDCVATALRLFVTQYEHLTICVITSFTNIF